MAKYRDTVVTHTRTPHLSAKTTLRMVSNDTGWGNNELSKVVHYKKTIGKTKFKEIFFHQIRNK